MPTSNYLRTCHEIATHLVFEHKIGQYLCEGWTEIGFDYGKSIHMTLFMTHCASYLSERLEEITRSEDLTAHFEFHLLGRKSLGPAAYISFFEERKHEPS